MMKVLTWTFRKLLIMFVALFLRDHHPGNIDQPLFSRFFIPCLIIHKLDIIGKEFIFASSFFHEKCFTVYECAE